MDRSEVGQDRAGPHVIDGRKTCAGIAAVSQWQAKPVHAGVELEPNGDRRARAGLLEQAELLLRGQHQPQVVPGSGIDIAGGQRPFQQQNRRGDARIAQLHGFVQAGHRKGIDAVAECAGDFERAVAVGIGLDDCQYSRVWGETRR